METVVPRIRAIAGAVTKQRGVAEGGLPAWSFAKGIKVEARDIRETPGWERVRIQIDADAIGTVGPLPGRSPRHSA